ncbi:unnamed protein product [Pleuronectes platessa]|uniref:Uncharacterized protein n=1 Tax=Pleuronectes platessa TaxID=8262 RepID=A0A9N7UES9_PLEPL|nr:unnamed protein product [Pleuronectes platessa]
MGVDGSQRIGAALTPRFGVASASGVNPAGNWRRSNNNQHQEYPRFCGKGWSGYRRDPSHSHHHRPTGPHLIWMYGKCIKKEVRRLSRNSGDLTTDSPGSNEFPPRRSAPCSRLFIVRDCQSVTVTERHGVRRMDVDGSEPPVIGPVVLRAPTVAESEPAKGKGKYVFAFRSRATRLFSIRGQMTRFTPCIPQISLSKAFTSSSLLYLPSPSGYRLILILPPTHHRRLYNTPYTRIHT